jgi:dihydroxy-acid dehydratase
MDEDVIAFDLLEGKIELRVAEEVLEERRRTMENAPPVQRRTYLGDFAKTVAQANEGCVSLSRLEASQAGLG